MAAPGAVGVVVLELEALGSPKMSVNGSELGVAAGVLALPDEPALLLGVAVLALLLLLLLVPPAPSEALPLPAAGVAGVAAAVLAGVGLVSAGLLLTAAAGVAAAVVATLGLLVGAGTIGLGLPAVIIGTAGLPAAPELAVGASLLQAAASASQTRQSARCWKLRKVTFGIAQYSHGASRQAPAWTTGVLLSTLWVIRREPPNRSRFPPVRTRYGT